jgi:hypothetical protein
MLAFVVGRPAGRATGLLLLLVEWSEIFCLVEKKVERRKSKGLKFCV